MIPIFRVCSVCGLEFELDAQQRYRVKARPTNRVYCSSECYSKKPLLNPKQFGTCKICHKPFLSYFRNKKYCCQACYQSDPDTIARLAASGKKGLSVHLENLGFDPDRPPLVVECAYCKKKLTRVSSKVTGLHSFCSRHHYRLFLSERFDRWVASPRRLRNLNNFDEFLTQESLPCLVDGCGWEGNNLSAHMNFTHGIRKDDFKRMAGFNISTGVVTPETSAIMSAAKAGSHDHFLSEVSSKRTAPLSSPRPRRYPLYRSLEGKEHRSKAKSLLLSSKVRPGVCLHCGKAFNGHVQGRALYCSVKCRYSHYKIEARRLALLDSPKYCAFCGRDVGFPRQRVYCSIRCRDSFYRLKRESVSG
jgi:hypothetical protein